MVDHFHEQVLALNKIGGKARAMVVTAAASSGRSSIFTPCPTTWPSARAGIGPSSPSRASTSTEARAVTEASLNGFSSNVIRDRIQEDPYRFLVCADKFQTGYDESRCSTRCTWTRCFLGSQGRANALGASTVHTRKSTMPSCSTS